jgi:phosphate transport system substrate-binding protein
VVVNKTVNIDNLSLEQLASIFSGKVTNWKDVGGADAAIQVVNRDEASGTYGAFLELVVQKVIKGAKYTTNAIVTKENGEVAAKVGSTPNSIGYIGMAFTDMVKSAGGKVLTVGGIEDTIANVVSKKYPISRSLYLVSKGALKDGSVEKDFVDFILSAKGQTIVKQAEFIPLPPK